MLTIIVARSKNHVIGMDNTIPWHLPADLKHFKKVTSGHTVIMGRLTWESLPKRPLPGRRNIVLTSSSETIQGAERFGSLEDALAALEDDEDAFIIGGEQIYLLAMPIVDRIVVSEIDVEIAGNRFFKEIDEKVWTPTSIEDIPNPDLPFRVVTYDRI